LTTILNLKMKKILIIFLVLMSRQLLTAQESTSAYNVLKLPTSGHVAALGGENVSIIDNDVAIAWHNPALLSNVQTNTLGLNFMTYFADSRWMGAQYARAFGERHTGALAIQYMDYGSQDETDAQGNVVGSFSAKDIVVAPSYSYLFNDKLWECKRVSGSVTNEGDCYSLIRNDKSFNPIFLFSDVTLDNMSAIDNIVNSKAYQFKCTLWEPQINLVQ
jgi:hypothetical protein